MSLSVSVMGGLIEKFCKLLKVIRCFCTLWYIIRATVRRGLESSPPQFLYCFLAPAPLLRIFRPYSVHMSNVVNSTLGTFNGSSPLQRGAGKMGHNPLLNPLQLLWQSIANFQLKANIIAQPTFMMTLCYSLYDFETFFDRSWLRPIEIQCTNRLRKVGI